MESQITLFDIRFDAIRKQEAVSKILSWIKTPVETPHYVVTPNVDHVVIHSNNEQFRRAYNRASMVLVDGKPVVWASRIVGRNLPETVPGSDLAPAIFDEAKKNKMTLKLFLLGAAPGVAEKASNSIKERWSNIDIVGLYSPPLGFEKSEEENKLIHEYIAKVQPDVVIVGLGAPKQEEWVCNNLHLIHAKVALCLGATIDFLAGEKKRAPKWMRGVGLEWLHRMLSEPRRLVKRYAKDAIVFPGLVWREWRRARKKSVVSSNEVVYNEKNKT